MKYEDVIAILEKHYAPHETKYLVGGRARKGRCPKTYYHNIEIDTRMHELMGMGDSLIGDEEGFKNITMSFHNSKERPYGYKEYMVAVYNNHDYIYLDFYAITGIEVKQYYKKTALMLKTHPKSLFNFRISLSENEIFWGNFADKFYPIRFTGWLNMLLLNNEGFRGLAVDIFKAMGKENYIFKDVAKAIETDHFFLPEVSTRDLLAYHNKNEIIKEAFTQPIKMNYNKKGLNYGWYINTVLGSERVIPAAADAEAGTAAAGIDAENLRDAAVGGTVPDEAEVAADGAIGVAVDAEMQAREIVQNRDRNFLLGLSEEEVVKHIGTGVFFQGDDLWAFANRYYMDKLKGQGIEEIDLRNFVSDFIRMARHCGRPVMGIETFGGLIRAHDDVQDEYMMEQAARRREYFEITEGVSWDEEYQAHECFDALKKTLPEEFKILNTPHLLFDEGNHQHNCVFSYRKEVAGGESSIYHWDKGKRSYTIEFKRGVRGYRIAQMLQRYNRAADPEDVEEIKKILAEITVDDWSAGFLRVPLVHQPLIMDPQHPEEGAGEDGDNWIDWDEIEVVPF